MKEILIKQAKHNLETFEKQDWRIKFALKKLEELEKKSGISDVVEVSSSSSSGSSSGSISEVGSSSSSSSGGSSSSSSGGLDAEIHEVDVVVEVDAVVDVVKVDVCVPKTCSSISGYYREVTKVYINSMPDPFAATVFDLPETGPTNTCPNNDSSCYQK